MSVKTIWAALGIILLSISGGIMGAYGAAIIARENYVQDTESSILKPEEMDSFSVHNIIYVYASYFDFLIIHKSRYCSRVLLFDHV